MSKSQTHLSDTQKRCSCLTTLFTVYAHGRISVIPETQTDYVIFSLKSQGTPGGIRLWNFSTLHDDKKTKLVLGPLTLLLTVGDCPSFILTISYAKKPLSRPVIHQYHKCISCIRSLSLLWENSDCTYSCKEQVLELALSDFFKDSQQAETILEPSQNNEKQSLSLIAGQVCLCCTSTYVYCFPSMEL